MPEPNLSGGHHVDDNQAAAAGQIEVIKPITGHQAPLTALIIWINSRGLLPGLRPSIYSAFNPLCNQITLKEEVWAQLDSASSMWSSALWLWGRCGLRSGEDVVPVSRWFWNNFQVELSCHLSLCGRLILDGHFLYLTWREEEKQEINNQKRVLSDLSAVKWSNTHLGPCSWWGSDKMCEFFIQIGPQHILVCGDSHSSRFHCCFIVSLLLDQWTSSTVPTGQQLGDKYRGC